MALTIANVKVLKVAPTGRQQLIVVKVDPGEPEIHDGCMHANEKPGRGVDVDEEKARQQPWPDTPLRGGWAPLRRRDGTILRQ